MADQMIRTASGEARPDSLPAAERAVLLNIETHSNWSASGIVTALCEKGLITHSGGGFVLTDQGRTTLEELLQDHRRRAREGLFGVRRFRTD